VKSLRGAGTVRLRLEVADSAGLAGWRLVADGKTWQEGSVEGQRVFRQEFDAPTSGVRSYRLECVATDGRQAYTNPVRLS
jgi:hypothetical protein